MVTSSTATFRKRVYLKNIMGSVVVLLALIIATYFAASQQAKASTLATVWCTTKPIEVDDYGWNPDKPLDRLYQMYFAPIAGVDLNSVRFYVYYNSEYVDNAVARLDGFNSEKQWWQFGVDTTWAWFNWDWKNEDNWRLDYDCTTAQPTITPTPAPTATPIPTLPPAANGIELVSVSNHTVRPGEQFSPSVIIRVTSGRLEPSRGDHLHATPEDHNNTWSAYPVQPLRRTVNTGETYTFDVSNDGAFRMTAPQSPGTYFSVWQMRVGGNHIGPQAVIRIVVGEPSSNNQAPGQPQPKSPDDWSEVRSELVPELCWHPVNDPNGDPVQYWAEVLDSAVGDSSGWISQTCWRPNNLNGKYFGYQWRVKAKDSNGAESSWSERWHFTLAAPVWNPPPPTATPQPVPTQPSVNGDWWNNAYTYRRPLVIPSSQKIPAGTLIKVDGLDVADLINQGKVRADYADLRIVRRDGASAWQEVARIVHTGWHIEFQLPAALDPNAGSTYYLYYGNTNAGSPPTFGLPQGWWVDMHKTKWWDSYVGTWEHTGAMNFDDVCGAPLEHRSRTGGSAFDDSDRFRGRIFVPTTGTWTFRIYTNDGYYLRINGGEVGHYSGYEGNRWVTVGSTTLKDGWHDLDAGNMWVNCGAWKLAMEGPGFSNQIVPAQYFQKVWGNVRGGVSVGGEEPYLQPTPTPTPQPDCSGIALVGVALYADASCRGDQRSFQEPGVYNLDDFDNVTTSIYVSDGWSVRVFDLANGEGSTYCTTESAWDFAATNYENGDSLLNDSISSIEVYENRDCSLPLELIEPLSLYPSVPLVNQLITARYVIKNVGWRTITLQGVGVVSRGPECDDEWACPTVVDFPKKVGIAIAPGQTYQFEAQRRYGPGHGYFAQPAYITTTGSWVPFNDQRIDFAVSVPTFTQPVTQNWNLLSFPIHPPDRAIEAALHSLVGSHGLIYVYDACNASDPWKSYDPGAPSYANSLDEIENHQGFWVQMAGDDALEISGSAPGFTSIRLCSGWNLVGFPSLEAKPLVEALSSVDGCYDRVYTYEAADLADPWKKFDSNAPSYANDLYEMEPGRGYWVHTNADCTWTLNE